MEARNWKHTTKYRKQWMINAREAKDLREYGFDVWNNRLGDTDKRNSSFMHIEDDLGEE